MKNLKTLLVFVLIFGISFAQQDTFGDNEWIKFKMSYSGFFKAGNSTLSVSKIKSKGKPAYHVVGKGWTTGPIKWFFKVKDRYETYFDANTLLPYRFVRNIDEGGYTKNVEIEFDQDNDKAYVNDKKHKRKGTFDTRPDIHDLISGFYYLRHKVDLDDLNPAEEVGLDMFFDEENFGFKLKYLGKEVIETEFGKVNAVKFRPYVMAGRVFKEEESLTLWVTNDKNKVPLRIKADLAVGSLRADLEAFKGLKHPFTSIVQN